MAGDAWCALDGRCSLNAALIDRQRDRNSLSMRRPDGLILDGLNVVITMRFQVQLRGSTIVVGEPCYCRLHALPAVQGGRASSRWDVLEYG